MLGDIDTVEALLREAAGLPACADPDPTRPRGFIARPGGCSCRVQLDHIDGEPVGGVTIMLRSLNRDAAVAVLDFLRGRNAPNGGAA